MNGIFKYFYVIFIVSAILYGSTYIGPLSIRQLTTLIMFIILLKEKVVFEFDGIIKCYGAFLFFAFLSSTFEGKVAIFLKDLIAYHFVALVAYQATIVLIAKYNAVKYLINAFVCVGIFSSVLTILQYYGYGAVTNQVLDILNMSLANEEYLFTIQESNENLANYSLSGAFESPVHNGYYLSLSGILALYPFTKDDNLLKRTLFLAIWLIVFWGAFCCQQRLAFVSLVFVSLFVFINNRSQFGFVIYFILLLGVYWLVSNFDTIDLGRYESFEDQSRIQIYSAAKEYFKNNLLYGGIWGFREYIGKSPHNLFLNSLAYSGMFGSIFMFYIIIVQIRDCLNIKELFSSSVLSFIMLGYLAITANSFTHNMSIVTGDVVFWIIWGAIFTYTRIEYCDENYESDIPKLD